MRKDTEGQNLANEFTLISQTSAWRKYTERIAKMKATRLNTLTSCKLERVLELQGAIRAIDTILDLPNRIVSEALGGKSTEEE